MTRAARRRAVADQRKHLLRPGAADGLRVVERAPHARGAAGLAHLPGCWSQRRL